MKVVLGPIGNSENSGFPSALSEISSKLLWFHLCEASLKYHSFLSTVTTWISSHGLGWVRWLSLPPCIFSSDFEVIWLLQQKGEGSDGVWGYSFSSINWKILEFKHSWRNPQAVTPTRPQQHVSTNRHSNSKILKSVGSIFPICFVENQFPFSRSLTLTMCLLGKIQHMFLVQANTAVTFLKRNMKEGSWYQNRLSRREKPRRKW